MPGCKYSDNIEAFQDLKPTVIVSSPSCAQVSNLGMKREDRAGLKDLKAEDFEFVQALSILFEREPDFFIVEYLKNFLNHFSVTHEGLYRERTNQFIAFPKKYRTQIIELDALSFGVPQKRRRLFIIFSRTQYDFIYVPPQDLSLETKTVGQVLRNLDEIRGVRQLPNDEIPYHTPERVEKFNQLDQGESYYGGQNNRRLKEDQYCPVITSHCTRHVHPWEPRTLNVREVATFQGFPYEFQFYGSNTIKLDLVGKTIPPPITKHLGESIKECINKYDSRN